MLNVCVTILYMNQYILLLKLLQNSKFKSNSIMCVCYNYKSYIIYKSVNI